MKNPFQALVIDGDPLAAALISKTLTADGWIVTHVNSADKAVEILSDFKWKLIFCNSNLGGADGCEILRRYTEQLSETHFILMTENVSAAAALDAIAYGADDYLVKPFDAENIFGISQIVRERHLASARAKKSESNTISPLNIAETTLIGKSPKIIECLKTIGRIAATNLPVLITGESGTGKEVVAQTIHQRGSRAGKPFVAVNCGAIPFELIESELFGHVKGAFTGADRERIGLWEEADGGTILLDEITETSLLFQVKLLRALQQGEIRRVGSSKTLKLDVRVIAATNRDIEEEVEQGRFRRDLMYRLNAVLIQLPPLRERREDIQLLAEYFARQIRPAAPVKFSPSTIQILKEFNWRGNVRELQNAVLHAVSLSRDIIYPHHLPERLTQKNNSNLSESISEFESGAEKSSELVSLAEAQARHILEVLQFTNGNKQLAAKILDTDRKTLSRLIKDFEQE